MDNDEFAQRLAVVRKRFAAKLAARIRDTEAALPILDQDGRTGVEALDATHRCIHELCGIGPTVGFEDTGRTARVLERILLEPVRVGRALSRAEVDDVRSGIDALRAAAQAECARYGFQWEQA